MVVNHVPFVKLYIPCLIPGQSFDMNVDEEPFTFNGVESLGMEVKPVLQHSEVSIHHTHCE